MCARYKEWGEIERKRKRKKEKVYDEKERVVYTEINFIICKSMIFSTTSKIRITSLKMFKMSHKIIQYLIVILQEV